MSLINEALKRAKEAQQPPPAASAGFPQLRAVESARLSAPSGLLPSITLALVAMLLLVIVWQWIHPRRLVTATVPTRTADITPARSPVPAKPIPVPAPAPAKTVVPQPAKSAPPPTTRPVATKPVVVPPQVIAAPQVPPATTPAVTVPPAPAPKPVASQTVAAAEPMPKLNLQAIVFNPTRPSAVINGRTLFLSDHISDFRVAAISQRTVTVVKPGKTNVLVLRD